MNKSLRIKFFLILGVVLVCLYGVIGLPRNKAELIANWENNIHLGLDLRGGTYLVIQVQQQDAFNAEAGTVADRLKDAARKAQCSSPMSTWKRPRPRERKQCRHRDERRSRRAGGHSPRHRR